MVRRRRDVPGQAGRRRPSRLLRPAIDGGGNRLNLVEELREAVEEGKFVLHYQPQLDLRTAKILAVEALMRWPHPRLGLIPPLKFLPLAEDAGSDAGAHHVGARAKPGAVRGLASGRAHAGGLGQRLRHEPARRRLHRPRRGLLGTHGLPAEALVIEITETSIITEFARSKRHRGPARPRRRSCRSTTSAPASPRWPTSAASRWANSSSTALHHRSRPATAGTRPGTGARHDPTRSRPRTARRGRGHRGPGDAGAAQRPGCDLAQGYFVGMPEPAEKLTFRPATRSERQEEIAARALAGEIAPKRGLGLRARASRPAPTI